MSDLAARWAVTPKRVRTIVAAGSFPIPVYLSPRNRRWYAGEVEAWEQDRKGKRQYRKTARRVSRGPLPMPALVVDRAA